ncbi:hypothetical protein H3221_022270 [Pseudomonas sp. LMG 31766]|uniref:Uncharacterized protein n=1 Tax=Pseudomonas chaetocerotis TaxID=2758695 RepID=A0A931D345_9PSED|nr:hypothetical protein [Pseudomonas chaetocerotis]MBZ9667470.1 hypothetical protein [Pseudomonas chaetocerotis]
MVEWQPAATVPRDRLILADIGMPWACLAIWNEPAGQFCVTELEIDLYLGQWNDTAISHTYVPAAQLLGWQELPEVSRG